MAHKEQKDFFEKVKRKLPEHFKNKRVLDVGSLDINGSHKYLFENCSYIGLDIDEGPNVDVVSIAHLYDASDNYFDTIISGSVFEHDMFYEKTITNIMRMLKPGGLFLFTCAGPGYPEHGTKRSGTQYDAPLLANISEEWADYYKNLSGDDFKRIPNFTQTFPDGYYEIKDKDIEIPSDFYFYGIKGGMKQIQTKETGPDQLNINFIDGPFVEIKDEVEKYYHIEFINLKTGDIVHQTDLQSNHWTRANKQYYIDWKIKITGLNTTFFYEHLMNLKERRVVISFESKSLGDTLAWIPYIEKFRVENNCTVICSTFHNKLFTHIYPDIDFIQPGSSVDDIYALYRVGVFRKGNELDFDKHKTDPRTEPLTKVASDILGLDYVELRPSLPVFAREKKKVVSIATHATAQSKYWNNPTGWQEVVDYLVSKGYEVKLLSREEDGYMGNKNPKNVTKVRSGSIENIIKTIQESELFIGLSSGLSWVSWAVGTETILISGFTDDYTEPLNGIRRIINKNVCYGCWSRHNFDPGDWNWCPDHKGTDRQFECTKTITSETVIEQVNLALGL